MTDLSIKVSSPSAKSASNRQPANSEAMQQGAQDFSNVLARQVADTPNTAESGPHSSEEAPQRTAERDNAETNPVENSDNSVTADMMAALLAQQNQTVTPQTDILAPANIQTNSTLLTDTNLQPAMETTVGADLVSARNKTAKTSLELLGVKSSPDITSRLEMTDAAMPQAHITLNNAKGFVDTFKTAVAKELSTVPGNQAQHGASGLIELAGSTQQPGVAPLAVLSTSSNNPVSIDTRVNQPAWGDEFSQKITWIATQRNQSAELHLNPPQLGPLDVVLKMNGDQASATFTSPHAVVREAIEQAMPKLREMLADSGIMLGNAMVSDNTAKHAQDNPPRKAKERSSDQDSSGITGAVTTQEVRVSPARRHLGMVDTFA